MVRSGYASLVFFIVLKGKDIFPGGNLQSCICDIFIYILRFCEDISEKTIIIIVNKYEYSEEFWGKKLSWCFINTVFLQPCMAGEFSPITKDAACRKKCICTIDLFYQNKRNH